MRNSIRTAQWQRLKPETPKKQRFLTGLALGSNQCFKLYEKAALERNWKPYELPTITSFYQIILEETIAGVDFSEDQIKKIYQQSLEKYEAMKLLEAPSNSQMQSAYDELILKALWVGTVFELSKNNSPEIQKKAQELLAEFDLEALIETQKKEQTTNETVEVKKPADIPAAKPVPSNAPGRKSKNTSSAVEEIILRTVTSYGLGGVYVTNEVNVLFANGDVFTNPSGPLDELNTAISKREKPKKWAKWRRSGSILKVTKPWKNKTYDWKKWFKLRPGNDVSRLKGRYKSIDPFGGSKVINANNVSFDGQGRFAWKNIKGGNTPWNPVYSKSNTAGIYSINNYTLTLKYNNGVSESFFFGFYPKDYEHFVIGSNHFVPYD